MSTFMYTHGYVHLTCTFALLGLKKNAIKCAFFFHSMRVQEHVPPPRTHARKHARTYTLPHTHTYTHTHLGEEVLGPLGDGGDGPLPVVHLVLRRALPSGALYNYTIIIYYSYNVRSCCDEPSQPTGALNRIIPPPPPSQSPFPSYPGKAASA